MPETLRPSLQIKHPKIHTVAMSPDGKLIAAVTEYHAVAVVNSKDGKLITRLQPASDMLMPLTFSPDGSTLALGGWEVKAEVFDTRSWGTRLKIPTPSHSLAYSPDGKSLAVGYKKVATVYDLKTGSPGITVPSNVRIDEIVYSPDGKSLIAGMTKELTLSDAHSGKPLGVLKHKSSVMSCRFSPDGKHLVTCGGGDGGMLWDLKTKKSIFLEHQDDTYGAEFSPDSKLVATAGSDNVAKIWKVPGGEPVQTLEAGEDSIFFAVFSPDGKRLVTVAFDGGIKVWDTKSWKPLAAGELELGNNTTEPVWYPNSKRFVLGGDDLIAVYDV